MVESAVTLTPCLLASTFASLQFIFADNLLSSLGSALQPSFSFPVPLGARKRDGALLPSPPYYTRFPIGRLFPSIWTTLLSFPPSLFLAPPTPLKERGEKREMHPLPFAPATVTHRGPSLNGEGGGGMQCPKRAVIPLSPRFCLDIGAHRPMSPARPIRAGGWGRRYIREAPKLAGEEEGPLIKTWGRGGD